MRELLVFLDAGLLSKLSKYFGKGKYLAYDIIGFAKNLADKENLNCKQIFYYTAPPFQSEPSLKEEIKRKEKYDRFVKNPRNKFRGVFGVLEHAPELFLLSHELKQGVYAKNNSGHIKKLLKNKEIIIKEGRCQRLKIDGKFIFKQKAVDSQMIMDLMRIPIDYPEIKKIILIASDSDFVPIIEYLRKLNIEVILYTHYSKKRENSLSRSNELLKVVSRYIEVTKQDFENAPLIKEIKQTPNKKDSLKEVKHEHDK